MPSDMIAPSPAASRQRLSEWEALDVVGAGSPGRRLVVCGYDGCEACEILVRAIQASPTEHSDRIIISHLHRGDVRLRSAHLRLGVRHYPTVMFVDDERVVGKLEGLIEDANGTVLSHYERFLAQGVLPPDLDRLDSESIGPR